jgi:hypothetical protein
MYLSKMLLVVPATAFLIKHARCFGALLDITARTAAASVQSVVHNTAEDAGGLCSVLAVRTRDSA